MFRFLIAFGAVCLFSVASAGVAEAGGGGAGGGKGEGNAGGGKRGSIEIINDGPNEITVFYRPEQDGSPELFSELIEFPSVTVAPNGGTASISDLEAGNYELAAAETSEINAGRNALDSFGIDVIIPDKDDPAETGFEVVEVADDSVTEVTAVEDTSTFGLVGITEVSVIAN